MSRRELFVALVPSPREEGGLGVGKTIVSVGDEGTASLMQRRI
jgi:hypothetical protein